MNHFSALQAHRLQFQPPLPPILQDLKSLVVVSQLQDFLNIDSEMQQLFPYTFELPFFTFQRGENPLVHPLKVGVVLSGGQAPGGHNVISGLWDGLKKLHPHSELIGFLDGPNGIIKNRFTKLTEKDIALYRNQGGFDIIGSGRTKIETPEQFDSVKNVLKAQKLDGLVIVGGDDSNTNAAFLAEFCRSVGLATRIVGVPKTIDGDLKNDFIEIPFGFDTATKTYSEIIGNLSKDCLSSKKYYFFVKMMGRSASHITLECALQTQINLALIGEEVAKRKDSLVNVVNEIADLICQRAEVGKNFGVILIPEGLLEFIPECKSLIEELNRFFASGSNNKELEQHLTPSALNCFVNLPKEIQKQLLFDRDPHGNVQLSKIETERLLIALVEKELEHRSAQGRYSGTFNPQPLFYGYEGRSALPSNFDCQYCYALGHLAALLIQQGASGYMCCIKNLSQPVEEWEIVGVPIVHMLHFEIRKNKRQAVIQKALVDLEGKAFTIFKQERKRWRLEDLYCCPGPIQFEGAVDVINARPLTLRGC